MLLLNHRDTAIGELLQTALAGVEDRFARELVSDLACVEGLVTHLEQYRGKMLRPTLVLVSGMASSETGSEVVDAHQVIASVAEMVHMATLVHDDVLDEASVRRRHATINCLKGNEAAVMLGDYLISHAYHLCSSLDSPACSRIIADATNTVCEGELLQLSNRGNLGLDERTYFQIIRRKTASFCGTCCRLGAVLSGASDAVAEDLHGYGETLGTAYQIIDDLLDLVGSEDTVGKTLGRDLEKGKLTLPVIHGLNHSSAEARNELLRIIKDVGPDESLMRGQPVTRLSGGGAGNSEAKAVLVREILSQQGSLTYARERAGALVSRAKKMLNGLEDSPSRRLLSDMADAVLTRKF